MRKTVAGALALMMTGAVIAAPTMRAAMHKPVETRAAIAAALAAPARADQAGDDLRRKAAEVLAFAGVGPGDVVVDMLPGRGYWTRIFTAIVGPGGHVVTWWPKSGAAGAERAMPALQALALANVSYVVGPDNVLTLDRPADLLWTVQNYHDLANSGGEAGLMAFNKAALAALKPGGTYIVIDHADAPGTGMTGTKTVHRIDPAAVQQQVVAAGFRFDGSSDVLRNPADDHKTNVHDAAFRGVTDQFVLRFRKPR